METATALSRFLPGVEGAASRRDKRKALSAWGLVASVGLHCAALACVAGWEGDREVPLSAPDMVVTLISEASPISVPPPQPTTTSPLSPSSKGQPDSAPHRAVVRKAGPSVVVPRTEPISVPSQPTDHADVSSNVATSSAEPSIGSGESSEGRGTQGSASDSAATPSAGNPAPVYPMSARHAGREGRTMLIVVVSSAGECKDVQIAESSGTPSLDKAAVDAVRLWRFSPAVRAGRTVETTVRVPITFKLTSASL
jgi:protein TonB